MLRKIFFILSLITFSISSATAAVYKWVDEKGNVHYSEQRPKQTEAERIKLDKAPPPSSSSYKKPSLKTKEDENNKDKDDTKAESNNAEIAKQKQQLCAEARKDLELMQSTGRLRVKDKDGNVNSVGILTSSEGKFTIAKSKKNAELMKMVDKKLELTGAVKESEGKKTIAVTSYKIIE